MIITTILKRDGRKEPYDRDKITMATWQSLWAVSQVKRESPFLTDADEIARQAADIEVPHEKADKRSELWKEAERLARIVEDALINANGSHLWGVEEIQDIREQTLLEAGFEAEAKAYIFYRNKKQEVRSKKQTLQTITNDLGISPNALAAMARRYLWKDKEGNITETPKEAMSRVATTVASSESQKDGPSRTRRTVLTRTQWKDRYLEIMTNFEFVPAGCYFRGAGNKQNGSLANCFVLPVEDSIEQIFDAVKWSALIHMKGGGTGFNFSHLRPRGDLVKGGGLASGPINFMKAFDAETSIVMQGGEHRGANMGILNVDHPDIFEFIRAKSVDGEISNFNISVGAFDQFMEAVEKDQEWSLINHRDKTTIQKIPARQLWNELIHTAHATGDPGMIYLDMINKYNPMLEGKKWRIDATNVCGEQPLFPFDVCFAEEARILSSKGYEEVRSAYERQQRGEKILIATHLNGRGREIILRPGVITKTGIKDTVKITLWNGQQLRVTPNHQIFTDTGWKEAGRLTQRDSVMIQSHMGGDLMFDSPEAEIKLQHLFGWFSGDGWFTDGSCGLTFGPQDTVAFNYLYPLWTTFSEYTHKVNIQKNFVRCLSSQKKGVMEKFRRYGFFPAKAYDKRVPPVVMIAKKQLQIAYLQGLFAADGSVVHNKPAATLISSSYGLLKDVQLMLLDLGIQSHIRHYYGVRPTGRAWAILQVSGTSFRRFMDLVAFPMTPYKQQKAESHFSRRTYQLREFIQVRAVDAAGAAEVYDVSEPETNSLVAEGIVVHNCNLGSINLAKFVNVPWWEQEISNLKSQISNLQLPMTNYSVNVSWSRLEHVIRTAVRFLDDGIDASTYPIPQIGEMAHKLRRIGLGVMGWADMLVKLGISYNSEEGIQFAEKIMKFIQEVSWEESERLSKEKGKFPLWDESYFNSSKNPFGKKRAVRNVAVTTIAPTGTISMIADCSSGIEPYFALEYTKNVVEKEGLRYTNRYYEEARQAMATWLHGYMATSKKNPLAMKQWNNETMIHSIFPTSHDIAPEWHVKMQAAFQKYTDNAVSKTINFPRTATVKDVEQAYLLAWKLGCKGITVYRDGSREGQILREARSTKHEARTISNDPSFSAPRATRHAPTRLMQSQLQITPLSQRAYQVERLELVEESIDGHCPECGSTLESVEGCSLCRNCGYSRCSL